MPRPQCCRQGCPSITATPRHGLAALLCLKDNITALFWPMNLSCSSDRGVTLLHFSGHRMNFPRSFGRRATLQCFSGRRTSPCSSGRKMTLPRSSGGGTTSLCSSGHVMALTAAGWCHRAPSDARWSFRALLVKEQPQRTPPAVQKNTHAPKFTNYSDFPRGIRTSC